MRDQVIETCWTVVGESGCRFQCGIYRDGGGHLEVRVGVPHTTELIHFDVVEDLDSARRLAARWLRIVLANTTFAPAPATTAHPRGTPTRCERKGTEAEVREER